MRTLAEGEHQSRKEKILQAVIHLYIKTGKPVGSSTILDSFHLGLSPATIRNVMAELEKDGFLTHPHTSAGRLPTDRGYRLYVDSIVKVQQLAAEEERRIREEYRRRMSEIDDLMLSTSRILSALSHCTGFVLPARPNTERLRRVELIPIGQNQILAVLVSESGYVRNQTITVQSLPDDETLRAASHFLNERMMGLNFTEAHARLTSELDQFERRLAQQNEFIKTLTGSLFGANFAPDLYMEGTSNILKFPEFQDYESVRNFAQLVDEKEALGDVLNHNLHQDGLQVRIGSEVLPELKDFSVVSSGYYFKGRPVGVLGILGPKRMEYGRMMAIVQTVAELMNRHLEGTLDHDVLEHRDK